MAFRIEFEGETNEAKYREGLKESLPKSAHEPRLWQGFTFEDNSAITVEWLQQMTLTALERPSKSQGLNHIEHLGEDTKLAVHIIQSDTA